jgi:hypothetical protein
MSWRMRRFSRNGEANDSRRRRLFRLAALIARA